MSVTPEKGRRKTYFHHTGYLGHTRVRTLAKNKGYGTPDHCSAIEKHKLSTLHRRTFVRRLVGEVIL
jgi:ribonuclease HII